MSECSWSLCHIRCITVLCHRYRRTRGATLHPSFGGVGAHLRRKGRILVRAHVGSKNNKGGMRDGRLYKLEGESGSLQLHVVSTPLPKLLTDCDVVFTSNITSAAVDAYCAGAPVVSVLEGETINMSPLRGLSGVVYVTNPAELVDALRTAQSRTGVIDKPFFYLDKGLPRWQKLLNLNLVDTEQ